MLVRSMRRFLPREQPQYCASKGEVHNFNRALAWDLTEEGIGVNNIAPKMILTPVNQEAFEDKEKEQVKHIPCKVQKTQEIEKLPISHIVKQKPG